MMTLHTFLGWVAKKFLGVFWQHLFCGWGDKNLEGGYMAKIFWGVMEKNWGWGTKFRGGSVVKYLRVRW